MRDDVYLRAELDGLRFAVSEPRIVKILSEPTASEMPDAPEGICGILYDEDAVYAIRSLNPARKSPAKLAVLCCDELGTAAYAADSVASMGELTDEELAGAGMADMTGILLLEKKDQDD